MIKRFPRGHDRVDDTERATGLTNEGHLVYIVEIDVGTLLNTGTKAVAHGLPSPVTILSVSGSASDGVTTIPLPN